MTILTMVEKSNSTINFFYNYFCYYCIQTVYRAWSLLVYMYMLVCTCTCKCVQAWLCECVWMSESNWSSIFLFSLCFSVCWSDYTRTYLLVFLRSIVLRPYHHLDSFEGLPVVSRVVLCGHVVPCTPEDPVPDSLVPLVIVLPVEVSRHACIKPPARAVVGTAVSRGVHVIVAVRRGEKFLVMVEVLVETDSVPRSPTTMTHQYRNVAILILMNIWSCMHLQSNVPVSTDRQPVE